MITTMQTLLSRPRLGDDGGGRALLPPLEGGADEGRWR
jgi:hypothetical protein